MSHGVSMIFSWQRHTSSINTYLRRELIQLVASSAVENETRVVLSQKKLSPKSFVCSGLVENFRICGHIKTVL